jgi:hypothetical protein
MAAKVHKLGPGLLKIGETGTEVDFSCQVTAAHLDTEVDESDEVTVLCGEVVPGARTYSHNLAGTILQDLTEGGIVEYSWDHKGETVPFTFQPISVGAAAPPSVSGDLIVDPLTIGGDEAGENMDADFEWKVVGTPAFTPVADAVLMAMAQTAMDFGEHATEEPAKTGAKA